MRYLLFFIVMTLWGCGVSKRSMKAKDTGNVTATEWQNLPEHIKDSAKSIYSALKNSKIDYITFSAKAKLKYQDARGAQPDGTAVIRMKKDSVIWVSVSSALLSIEVARLYITPDSLVLLNKLDKIVEYHPFSYLQTLTNLPVNFQTMQELLVGNAVFTGDSVTGYENSGTQILLNAAGNGFKSSFQITGENRISKISVRDSVASGIRNILFYYADYQPVNQYFFPYYREIYVEDASKTHVAITFTQVEFNKELSISFNVPDNYKIK